MLDKRALVLMGALGLRNGMSRRLKKETRVHEMEASELRAYGAAPTSDVGYIFLVPLEGHPTYIYIYILTNIKGNLIYTHQKQ